jgi:hypothetical protein
MVGRVPVVSPVAKDGGKVTFAWQGCDERPWPQARKCAPNGDDRDVKFWGIESD